MGSPVPLGARKVPTPLAAGHPGEEAAMQPRPGLLTWVPDAPRALGLPWARAGVRVCSQAQVPAPYVSLSLAGGGLRLLSASQSCWGPWKHELVSLCREGAEAWLWNVLESRSVHTLVVWGPHLRCERCLSGGPNILVLAAPW